MSQALAKFHEDVERFHGSFRLTLSIKIHPKEPFLLEKSALTNEKPGRSIQVIAMRIYSERCNNLVKINLLMGKI